MTSTLFTMVSSGASDLTNSVISMELQQPIYLDKNKRHVLGLVNLSTYNSIPNINFTNNIIYLAVVDKNVLKNRYVQPSNSIILRKGSYELKDLEFEIRRLLERDVFPYLKEEYRNDDIFSLIPVVYRNAVAIKSSCIHFITNYFKNNLLTKLLGFEDSIQQLIPTVRHESTRGVNITNINTIHIHCDITKNSYHNGQNAHIIYSFPINVPPGYAIKETPKNIIYLPIQYDTVKSLSISIMDQKGNLIDFQGEKISLTLEMKEIV